jgi:hypothetical protein
MLSLYVAILLFFSLHKYYYLTGRYQPPPAITSHQMSTFGYRQRLGFLIYHQIVKTSNQASLKEWLLLGLLAFNERLPGRWFTPSD